MAAKESAPRMPSAQDDAWLTAQKNAFQAAMNGEPLDTSLGILARAMRDLDDGTLRDREVATRLTHAAAILVSYHQQSEERTRAVEALRASEERQAFMLRLSDTLRSLTDPMAIQKAAMTFLARQLGVDRAAYFEVDADENGFVQTAGHESGNAPLPGRMRISDFGADIVTAYRAGQTYVVKDAESDPRVEPQRGTYRAINVRSWVGVPLIKDGRLYSVLGINDPRPRDWTPAEIQLLQEVAERTWSAVERARTEIALRESEGRLLAAFEALPGGIGIIDTEGRVLLSNRELGRFLPTGKVPSRDEERGNRWRAWYPDGRPMDPRHFPGARALRGERVVPGVDMLYTQDDGREIWTNVAAVPIYDEQGFKAGEVCVINDIDTLKRSLQASRESEKRFQQFAAASSGALWIRDAKTLNLEYASPAISSVYGVEPGEVFADVRRWAATIVPEDRELALEYLQQARAGIAVVHEFRVQRATDKQFRWIRNTEFPLYDEQGQVQRIGGIAEDITENKLAGEHQAVLLAELQHRVRNIMTIIRAIAVRTGDRADSVANYSDIMAGRLLALARVQALLTQEANVGAGMAAIVHDELAAQAPQGQYTIDGPSVSLPPKAAEIVTLAVHELATNALKYGAFSTPAGKVTVRWNIVEKHGSHWLRFEWLEEGTQVRAGPVRRGFGSELIEGRIPYELGGTGRVAIETGGAHCHLEFPLEGSASILETGAPRRATVFGGALDMPGKPDLGGRRVLVVEDEYYIASDTARALQGAGAEILGPCASEDAARTQLEGQRPDAALVDINLGRGPSFKLAEILLERQIPFVFVTGYDQEVIPEKFAGVERLQKPVQLRQMVDAVARLVG